jgi:hypothetical protein
MTYVGSRVRSLPSMISAVQERKLIFRDDQAFWHSLSLQRSKQRRIWKIFLWCASIQMSFRQITLDYHHRRRWSLGLSVCQALILSLKHLMDSIIKVEGAKGIALGAFGQGFHSS